MSTEQKIEQVNELVSQGMPKGQALKKVKIPYGTYYSATRKTKPAKAKRSKAKPYTFKLPEIPSGGASTITLSIKDFAALLKEVSRG